MTTLFRSRALQSSQRAGERAGALRLTPEWTDRAYWVIVSGALAAVLYVACARVDEWAQGPALIRVDGTTELTARRAGTVAKVLVEPGQHVQKGALLVSLNSEVERAQLTRLEHEFDLQLARSLRDPGDQAARQSLVGLRGERDLARANLAELSLRAASDGVVEDVGVRAGQALAPGDQILTLGGHDRTCTVWALLPGRYRPELQPGSVVRFNVHGYRYAQASTKLTAAGAQVLGPREVARYLGNEVAGALDLQGSTVIAKAQLPSCNFTSDEQTYLFHQGMSGTGEVQLRSEPLVAVLFPDLRKVLRWFE